MALDCLQITPIFFHCKIKSTLYLFGCTTVQVETNGNTIACTTSLRHRQRLPTAAMHSRSPSNFHMHYHLYDFTFDQKLLLCVCMSSIHFAICSFSCTCVLEIFRVQSNLHLFGKFLKKKFRSRNLYDFGCLNQFFENSWSFEHLILKNCVKIRYSEFF